jgi:hypothetical protein
MTSRILDSVSRPSSASPIETMPVPITAAPEAGGTAPRIRCTGSVGVNGYRFGAAVDWEPEPRAQSLAYGREFVLETLAERRPVPPDGTRTRPAVT